jgi:hypothetical protein
MTNSAVPILSQQVFPEIPRKTVIATVPSGEIRMEDGADGAWLVFDCECLDALPFCRAQCCGLKGTIVRPDEQKEFGYEAYFDESLGAMVVKRDADGMCHYLDRKSKTCSINDIKPQTCNDFHCSRGADVRGWKLNNFVNRHSGL